MNWDLNIRNILQDCLNKELGSRQMSIGCWINFNYPTSACTLEILSRLYVLYNVWWFT